MATIKSYSDLEQSKKLAEILPLKTADMHYSTWAILNNEFIVSPNYENTIENMQEDYGNQIIPCWSLAALLDYLSANFYTDIKYLDNQWELDCHIQVTYSGDLLNACYQMIIRLHELKLL